MKRIVMRLQSLRSATKMRVILMVFAGVAVVLTTTVGAYALTVKNDEVASQKAVATQKAVVKANQPVIDQLVAAADSEGNQSQSTASSPSPTQASPTQQTATAQAPKKTTYSTDGLTGAVTSYTEGCVPKRAGYPDPDCDARAAAGPIIPAPTKPTFVTGVRPGTNAYNYGCSSTHAASAYFDLSDSRGGLVISFHFEFDNASPTTSDGSTPIDSQTYTVTSRAEPTAPNLPGSATWFDNDALWLYGYNPSRQFRVHVTSPSDMVSSWKSIYFAASC